MVLRPDVKVTSEDLVAHWHEHLAAYNFPRAVQFVDEVPVTASGNIEPPPAQGLRRRNARTRPASALASLGKLRVASTRH